MPWKINRLWIDGASQCTPWRKQQVNEKEWWRVNNGVPTTNRRKQEKMPTTNGWKHKKRPTTNGREQEKIPTTTNGRQHEKGQ